MTGQFSMRDPDGWLDGRVIEAVPRAASEPSAARLHAEAEQRRRELVAARPYAVAYYRELGIEV